MGWGKKSEVQKNYTFGAELGSGNFATVFKCERKKPDENGIIPNQVAIKVIDKAKVEDMNDVEREIQIMQEVKHKNVIKLFEFEKTDKNINLVMELVTGGELFDRIVEKGSYSEREAANAMVQLFDALHALHTHKTADPKTGETVDCPIVHRDLKPENILYASRAEDAPLKLADFGLARMVSDNDIMKTACGTPGYVAPEVLKNKGYQGGAVDMWSAGVVLYILLCGFPPFYEEELPKLFDQILNARYDFPSPWWDSVSPDAKSLVKALLTVDTDKRLDAKGAMEHAWIQSASDKAVLDGARSALKKYNASRRLKKAAHAVIANNKLSRALEGLRLASGSAAGAGSSG